MVLHAELLRARGQRRHHGVDALRVMQEGRHSDPGCIETAAAQFQEIRATVRRLDAERGRIDVGAPRQELGAGGFKAPLAGEAGGDGIVRQGGRRQHAG
ncbi:hypothetical protein D9M68_703370 [compost metagenome]